MLRLFLPLYALIALFILFNQELNDFAVFQYALDNYKQDKKADYRSLFVVMDRLAAEIDIDSYQALLDEANPHSNIPLYLIPRSELTFSTEAWQQLEQGKIWIEDAEEQLLFRVLANTDYVVSVGPMHTIEALETQYSLIAYSITLGFIALILLWAFDVQRRLHHLNRVTQAFGRGELLSRANIRTWQRVGNLNQSFNQMAQRVQDLIQSHKDLNNAVSHELRTPIARLSFELESLREFADDAEQQSLLNDMEEDINELEQLVDELLRYARLERAHSHVPFQYLRFDEWLQQWQQRHRHHAAKPLHIQTPLPQQPVPILPDMLNRALDNLVFNAYRYAHTQVCISANIQNNTMILHVDDDGDGIPEAQRVRLFEPFVRVDKSRSRKTGGFGLGLSIVQEIARRHGGEATVTDSPLGGARFSLRWEISKR